MRDHSGYVEKTRHEAMQDVLDIWTFERRVETIEVTDALGRVAAEDVLSKNTLPNKLTSNMDGIAVHFAALEGAAPDTSTWVRGVDWQFCNTGIGMPEDFDTAVPIEWVHVSEDEQHVTLDRLPERRGHATTQPGANLREGDVLVRVWIITITRQGLEKAFFMILRISMLVTGTFMITYTTSPIALTDGLEQLLRPLNKIKVPVHELSMMMCIALRFIPTLTQETEARGADFESGNLVRRAKALVPILVPLFISAFRRADELATAMECRCYHGGEGRTKMKVLRYTRLDLWAFLLGAVVLAAAMVLRIFGL